MEPDRTAAWEPPLLRLDQGFLRSCLRLLSPDHEWSGSVLKTLRV